MFDYDFDLRLYSVVLVLVASLLMLLRYPAGNIFLGFAVFGLGSQAIIGSLTFAMLVPCIQSATALRLLLSPVRGKRRTSVNPSLAMSASLFALVLLVLWVKVALECLAGGIDESRRLSLRIALYITWLPATVLLLSLRRQGLGLTARQVFVGLCALPLAYLIPVLPRIVIDGRLTSAIFGVERLRIFGLDSINSGNMLFLGSAGFMVVALTVRYRVPMLRLLFGGISAVLFVLLALNGTRQFVLALVVFFICVMAIEGISKDYSIVLVGLLMVMGIYGARRIYTTSMLSQRLSIESFGAEMEGGRGQIWREAIATGISHPLRGAGFRGFGEEIITLDPDTKSTRLSRDTAHGFFQDAVAEHGLLLAAFLVVGVLIVVCQAIGMAVNGRVPSHERILIALLLLVCLPENLSGTIADSFGYTMLAVTMAHLALQSRRQHHLLRRAKIGQVSLLKERFQIGAPTNLLLGFGRNNKRDVLPRDVR